MSDPQNTPTPCPSGELELSSFPDLSLQDELQAPATPLHNPQMQTADTPPAAATPRSQRWHVRDAHRLMSTAHSPTQPSAFSQLLTSTPGATIAPRVRHVVLLSLIPQFSPVLIFQFLKITSPPIPPAAPATTPHPWYRAFTNIFRDFPGNPHTAAFVLVCGGWNLSSEPKRPVRPSLAMDGTDCRLGWMPGTDGGCGVRPGGCPGRTVGTAGVLDGAIH